MLELGSSAGCSSRRRKRNKRVDRSVANTHQDRIPAGAETYSSAMADANNYISWILDSFSGYIAAPIIEVGVGHGSYASRLRGYGDYIGVDIDADSVAAAQRRMPATEFRVSDITGREFADFSTGRQVRTILCLNVLEHIENDRKAISNLANSLVSGGHLLIIVPALQLLYNDLDRLAGHHRRYRRSEVRQRLLDAGFEVVRCDYFNSIGGLGWLANRAARHDSLNDTAVNSQIALFDRWLVPISRMVDTLARPFFGQSVIAVGRKQ